MFTRTKKSINSIALDGIGTVATGAVFKQYDINTSILVMDITFNDGPADIQNKEIYISLKNSNGSLITNKWGKYSNKNTQESEVKGILLSASKLGESSISFTVSALALEMSGDIIGEIILVDPTESQRITSQSFSFKIEPSLTPNLKQNIEYINIQDIDGYYITDIENYELLAPTLEENATAIKLDFAGDEIVIYKDAGSKGWKFAVSTKETNELYFNGTTGTKKIMLQ